MDRKKMQAARPTALLSVLDKAVRLVLGGISLLLILAIAAPAVQARTITISILMASAIRQGPVEGLKEGLARHADEWGQNHTQVLKIRDAGGDRNKLPAMAAEMIAEKPDVAIAAGGIEADALLAASAGTEIPVVFLSVSSAVERGIVASMVSSGNNFTGIDTNDTELTAKRLWFIRKILPDAEKIFCFNVPSIVPSVKSLEVAKKNARELGFTIHSADVESEADIKNAAASLSRTATDVILLLPAAPIDKALQPVILPRAMAENIPVFGYGQGSIEAGAFASYAGSRYANGAQAVRLIHKIVHGTPPRDIPVETPEKLELVINKNLAARLGLNIPQRVWRMADRIVDIQF